MLYGAVELALAFMNNLAPIALAFVLGGCAYHTTPPDNAAFGAISDLSELAGTFWNQGEGADSQHRAYLSQLIWPDVGLNHPAISKLRVTAEGNNTLRVRAFSNDTIVKDSLFLGGRDFELRAGRVVVRRGCSLAGGEPGAMVMGTTCITTELGLDSGGDGKADHKSNVAGLALLVFPVVATTSDEVRFRRVSE